MLMIKRRLLWIPLLLLACLLQAGWLLAYERLLEGKAIIESAPSWTYDADEVFS